MGLCTACQDRGRIVGMSDAPWLKKRKSEMRAKKLAEIDRRSKRINRQAEPRYFDSLKDWEENVESFEDREWFSHGNSYQTSKYWMEGFVIEEWVYFPWNFFKDTQTWVDVCSINVPYTHPIIKLAAKYGCVFDENPYGDNNPDGRKNGSPRFKGETAIQNCWLFLVEWNKQCKEVLVA